MSNLRHKPPGPTRTQLAQEVTRVGPTSMFGVVENELTGNRTALGLGGEQTFDVTRTSSVLSRELWWSKRHESATANVIWGGADTAWAQKRMISNTTQHQPTPHGDRWVVAQASSWAREPRVLPEHNENCNFGSKTRQMPWKDFTRARGH